MRHLRHIFCQVWWTYSCADAIGSPRMDVNTGSEQGHLHLTGALWASPTKKNYLIFTRGENGGIVSSVIYVLQCGGVNSTFDCLKSSPRNNRIISARRAECTDIFQRGVIQAGHGPSSGWSGCHPCAGTHCVNGPFATYFDVPPVSSVCLSITPSHNYLLHFTQWTQSFLCLSANSSDVQREPCH